MCAPSVIRAVKRKPTPWIKDDIRNAKEERNMLRRELRIDTRTSWLRERYKIAKKLTSKN